jgi:hypothetical protein
MSQLGTDGNDFISATQNVVYALDGNDRIFTSQGSPDVYGGEGHDFIANQGLFVGRLAEPARHRGGGADEGQRDRAASAADGCGVS